MIFDSYTDILDDLRNDLRKIMCAPSMDAYVSSCIRRRPHLKRRFRQYGRRR